MQELILSYHQQGEKNTRVGIFRTFFSTPFENVTRIDPPNLHKPPKCKQDFLTFQHLHYKYYFSLTLKSASQDPGMHQWGTNDFAHF